MVVHRPVPAPVPAAERRARGPHHGRRRSACWRSSSLAVGAIVVLWRLDPVYGTLGDRRSCSAGSSRASSTCSGRRSRCRCPSSSRASASARRPGRRATTTSCCRRPDVANRSGWWPPVTTVVQIAPEIGPGHRGRRRWPTTSRRSGPARGVHTARFTLADADGSWLPEPGSGVPVRLALASARWCGSRRSASVARPEPPAAPPGRRRDLPQRRPRRRHLRQPRDRPGRHARPRALLAPDGPQPAAPLHPGPRHGPVPRPGRTASSSTSPSRRTTSCGRPTRGRARHRGHRQRRRHAATPSARAMPSARRPAGCTGSGRTTSSCCSSATSSTARDCRSSSTPSAQAPDRVRLLVVGGTQDLVDGARDHARTAGCDRPGALRRPARRPDARPSTPRTSSRCRAPTSRSASSSSRRSPSACRSSRPTSASSRRSWTTA